jgi:hypothetical protein
VAIVVLTLAVVQAERLTSRRASSAAKDAAIPVGQPG